MDDPTEVLQGGQALLLLPPLPQPMFLWQCTLEYIKILVLICLEPKTMTQFSKMFKFIDVVTNVLLVHTDDDVQL